MIQQTTPVVNMQNQVTNFWNFSHVFEETGFLGSSLQVRIDDLANNPTRKYVGVGNQLLNLGIKKLGFKKAEREAEGREVGFEDINLGQALAHLFMHCNIYSQIGLWECR